MSDVNYKNKQVRVVFLSTDLPEFSGKVIDGDKHCLIVEGSLGGGSKRRFVIPWTAIAYVEVV